MNIWKNPFTRRNAYAEATDAGAKQLAADKAHEAGSKAAVLVANERLRQARINRYDSAKRVAASVEAAERVAQQDLQKAYVAESAEVAKANKALQAKIARLQKASTGTSALLVKAVAVILLPVKVVAAVISLLVKVVAVVISLLVKVVAAVVSLLVKVVAAVISLLVKVVAAVISSLVKVVVFAVSAFLATVVDVTIALLSKGLAAAKARASKRRDKRVKASAEKLNAFVKQNEVDTYAASKVLTAAYQVILNRFKGTGGSDDAEGNN